MKSVLCYGDSNTWGYCAATGSRFPYGVRWTTLLQKHLGEAFLVIPEGLNGRTTVFDDPFTPHRNGLTSLPVILESHKPLDLVILMLGTNDTKEFFSPSVYGIGWGMRTLAAAVRGGGYGPGEGDPEILMVAPAPVIPGDRTRAPFDLRQFDGAPAISRELAREYADAARETGCHFLDAAGAASADPLDGVHLGEKDHAALAALMAEKVKAVFSKSNPEPVK